MLRFDAEQYARVQAFFEEFEPHGRHPGLVRTYQTPDKFDMLS